MVAEAVWKVKQFGSTHLMKSYLAEGERKGHGKY